MNYTKSEELLKRSIALNEKMFGKNASQLPPTLIMLAHQYFWFGKIEEAAQLGNRVAQIQQTTHQSDPQTDHLLKMLRDYLAAVETSPDYVNVLDRKITHWRVDGNPILVYIAPGNSFSAWKPANVDLVKSSFQDWQNVLQDKIRFVFTSDPSLYDIQVKWLDRPIGYQTEELHEMGRNVQQIKDDTIASLDLEISLNAKDGFVIPQNQLRAIMLHEIGHMLGIWGHSTNPTDVMFSIPHSLDFSQRDINTMRALYSMPPQITNPAGIRLSQYKVFDDFYTKGSAAFNAHDFPAAYNFFVQALQVYPADNYTKFLLGFSALNTSRFEEGARYCEVSSSIPSNYQFDAYECTANSLYNGTVDALNQNRGLSIETKNRLDKAKHYYRLALRSPKMDVSRKTTIQNLLYAIDRQEQQRQQQAMPSNGFPVIWEY